MYDSICTLTTRFTWDEKKNKANRQKHDISFETAVQVFIDPNAITRHDMSIDGEERLQTIRFRRVPDCSGCAHAC